MIDQSSDQLSIPKQEKAAIHEIEQVESLSGSNFSDMAALVLNLEQTRSALFPVGYFPNDIWTLLLELYIASETADGLTIEQIALKTGMSNDLTIRYLNLLVKDGFIYREDMSPNRRELAVRLSQKGRDHMAKLLSGFEGKISDMMTRR